MYALHFFESVRCPTCESFGRLHLLHCAAQVRRIESSEHTARWHPDPDRFRGLVCCSQCHGVVAIDFSLKPGAGRHGAVQADLGFLNRLVTLEGKQDWGDEQQLRLAALSSSRNGANLCQVFQIDALHPRSSYETPKHLPEWLASEWEQLQGTLAVPRYTVVACRRIIEQTARKRTGLGAAKLYDAIDRLVTNGEILPVMATWAHAIRVLGNDAVHDDGPPPTPEEATELTEFTRILLELLYTYPERVRLMREKPDAAK